MRGITTACQVTGSTLAVTSWPRSAPKTSSRAFSFAEHASLQSMLPYRARFFAEHASILQLLQKGLSRAPSGIHCTVTTSILNSSTIGHWTLLQNRSRDLQIHSQQRAGAGNCAPGHGGGPGHHGQVAAHGSSCGAAELADHGSLNKADQSAFSHEETPDSKRPRSFVCGHFSERLAFGLPRRRKSSTVSRPAAPS